MVARLGLSAILSATTLIGCEQDVAEKSSEPSALHIDREEIALSPDDSADGSASCDFRLENRGGSDLVIETLRTSCGCTDAAVSRDRIPPGEFATLRVALRTMESASGFVTIDVETNAPVAGDRRLSVSWDAKPIVRLVPGHLDFGKVLKGDVREFELSLQRTDGEAIGSHLAADFRVEANVASGGGEIVQISTMLPAFEGVLCVGDREGRFVATVTVRSESGQNVTSSHIEYEVVAAIRSEPAAFVFVDDGSATATGRLALSSFDEGVVEIESVDCSPEICLSSWRCADADAARADVIFNFPAEQLSRDGLANAILRVACIASGERRVVEIPVSCIRSLSESSR